MVIKGLPFRIFRPPEPRRPLAPLLPPPSAPAGRRVAVQAELGTAPLPVAVAAEDRVPLLPGSVTAASLLVSRSAERSARLQLASA